VLRNGGFQLGGQKRTGRARERRGGVADDDCGNNTRKRERGEEGRERRDQDRYNTSTLGGRGMPIDAGTGGVRGNDERGDRTAEEWHERVQT
jgi:hypothetical protein